MSFELREHQKAALKKMRNGCILNGSVGSGKSLTSLAYYYIFICGGSLTTWTIKRPKDLYVITTAMKRDRKEWPIEFVQFGLHEGANDNGINIKVDSWNNIGKYVKVEGAFFIFDEQRVVGKGAWVKAFLTITKRNKWILLSATPGDNFMDYCPVFIANGFYRNRTDFIKQHVIPKPYVKYWAVDRYVNVRKLYYYRDLILVPMDFERNIEHHHMDVIAPYSSDLYKSVMKDRWNIYENRPVTNASELCYLLRRIVNSSPDRVAKVLDILKDHNAIIFYNFDYELELLREMCTNNDIVFTEWNGHKHQDLPKDRIKRWCYLVQYNAGSEGWNCIETDTLIFFSLNHSYKMTEQASGRIDRLNTPFVDLYYYKLVSKSWIDRAILNCLRAKKDFNDRQFVDACGDRDYAAAKAA